MLCYTFMKANQTSGFGNWISYVLGERSCGALWFLPMLFSSILIACLIKKTNSKFFQWACVMTCLLVSILLCHFYIVLPLNLDISLFMLVYVYAAMELKEKVKYCKFNSWTSLCAGIIVGVVLAWVAIDKNAVPNFYYSKLGLLPFTIIASGAGIYLTLWLSYVIDRYAKRLSYFLNYVGRNSINFLSIHAFALPLLRAFVEPHVADKGIGLALLELSLVLIICFLGSKIMNRYLQFTIQ